MTISRSASPGIMGLWVGLSACVLSAAGGSALGQTSYLDGVVYTTSAPSLQQSYTNVQTAALTGLRAVDAIGNDALANGTLSTPAGQFTISSHACSGGGPGFGGQANGIATSQEILDYQVVSATLPIGTPVMVKINWAVSASVMAVGQDLVGANSGASGTATAQIAIALNGATVLNTPGSLNRSHSIGGGGFNVIRSGTLHVEDSSDDQEYPLLVGQTVRMFLAGTASSSSSSEGGSTTDADVQMAMVWGLTCMNPAATVVLFQSNPAQPAPPASMATPERAVEIRDPRPTGMHILPCFRMPGQPDALALCQGATAQFGAFPLGTGPFTFGWRKDGVLMDTVANPSAATTTLTLTNVTAADEGSYDCVITNPCGSITSNAAPLTVEIAPEIAQQPTPMMACPTGSAMCSIQVESTATLTYTWQVRTAPGEPWIAPGDDPGTPLPCGGFAFVTPPNARTITMGVRPCPTSAGYPMRPQHIQVRCIVSSPCGSTTSAETTYTICPADLNCSGTVTVQDIFDFLAAWFAGDPRTDFNSVGGLSVQDIFDFLAAWFAGC